MAAACRGRSVFFPLIRFMTLLKRKSIEAVASRRPARAKREDRQSHDDEPKRMAPRFAPVTFSELAGVR